MNIKDLVSKYKADRESYIKPSYNETQLRNDFIDPFLECLGWDVDNIKGKSQYLRDVIQEEYIEIEDESNKKNPDYTLRINGMTKLFVEVKKPYVDIIKQTKKAAEAAFQTRRYGWSANLGVSILTNFENTVIYDCRFKPDQTDDEHVARYRVFSYENYEEAIEEIRSLISYEAISSGNIEELFGTDKRDKETFDEYFLKQIEKWREQLAINAIEKNSDLDEESINYIIQRLLNRIIFLRICEDRTIEDYETMKKIKSYDELKNLFIKSDKKFNSGLFDFIEDNLSLKVDIDSSILIEIFNDLYFPNSPYDFAVVDPTILSQIYERFLGRKITIASNRTLNIIEVPEVSASSGVVPTPKVIVEQIVRDTLAPLTENKSYSELCNLKIADICCGSGTFLISAYDFLLKKMMERVIQEDNKDPDLTYEVDGKGKRFTLKAKRVILENILHGVDINPYAVEVTEFSLLLKLLEEENSASINSHINKYSQKALPDLGFNIKCGNSVVDSKFFDFMPEALDNDDLLFKVNVFDWKAAYPSVMEKGGFDAIIGNPPYVRIQNMTIYIPEEVRYYQSNASEYSVAKKATIDKYFVFIQRALELLNPEGLLGYIVPHKFFTNKSGKALRKLITENYQISKVTHFGTTQIFPERTTYTAILILQKNKKENFHFKKVSKVSAEELYSDEHTVSYQTENFDSNPWIFVTSKTKIIFDKLKGEQFELLGDITDISVGLQTSADKVYIFKPEDERDGNYIFSNNGVKYEVEKSICRSAIYDLSFSAFETIEGNAQMIFPYDIKDGEAKLLDEKVLENKYPLTWKYLNSFKKDLEKRALQGNDPKWYQYGRSQSLTKFNNTEKLIWSVLAKEPPYVLDIKNLLFTGGGNGPYYGLINKSKYSLLYILGILTHPLIEQIVKAGASEFKGDYYSHGKQFIKKLPIRKIDFDNKDEVEKYELVLKNVENIISTTSQLQETEIPNKKITLTRKLDAIYSQIVKTINDLYGISAEELRTVEEDEMLSIVLGENINGSE